MHEVILDDKKYFSINFRIGHPNMDPTEITGVLKLEPFLNRIAGDDRVTPKGTKLPGVWPESVWTHVIDYQDDEDLVVELEQLVNKLYEHKEYLIGLNSNEGKLTLHCSLPGEVHHGFMIPVAILEKLVEMDIAFGMEIFPDWIIDECLASKPIEEG